MWRLNDIPLMILQGHISHEASLRGDTNRPLHIGSCDVYFPIRIIRWSKHPGLLTSIWSTMLPTHLRTSYYGAPRDLSNDLVHTVQKAKNQIRQYPLALISIEPVEQVSLTTTPHLDSLQCF